MIKKPKYQKSLSKAEWRHLFKNKMLLISVIVILFIPIMYGGFFLGSIWDPYGSTGNLPVVVVNDDTGATLDGKKINIGNDLVADLKNDTGLKWQFQRSSDAEKGMKENRYYMMVTLPSDFSANAATVTDKLPKQSVINYKVAASKNYIGTVISDEAIAQLKSKVSEKLSEAYIKSIFAEVNNLTSGMKTATDGASQINSGIITANNGSKALVTGLNTYTTGVGALTPGQLQLNSGLGLLRQGSLQIESGLSTMSSSLPSSSDITALKTGLGQVQVGLSQLNSVVSAMGSNTILQNDLTTIGTNLSAIGSLTTQQGSDLATLTSTINSSSASSTEKDAMLALVSQISGRLKSQGTAVQTAGFALDDVSSQLTAMQAQTAQLQTTISQLDSGMTTANAGSQVALSGFTTIRTATAQLLAGAHSLSTNLNTALGGSNQLLAGVNALNAGSPALTTGAKQLSSGLGQLSDGSAELYAKLSDASSQLSMQNVTDAVATHISDPVTTDKTAQGNVANYGHALAPYVLSLGLFVGALVFNFIYPVRKIFGEITSGARWWFAKLSVGFVVAILQATVLNLIMLWCLGLKLDNMAQFFAITYITSCTYMAIVMFLSMALNNPGRFIAMILLVLQLGGAGGTFPLQLSNGFFQSINPFLPMTYSILGLRESISSGLGNGVFWSSFLVLLVVAVVFNLFMLVMLSLRHKHGFAPDEE